MRLITSVVLLALLPHATTSAQSSGAETGDPPRSTVFAAAFFAVSVSDLESSTAWYRETLGLTQVREASSREGRGRARILRRDGLVVELIHYQGSTPRRDLPVPGAHALEVQGLFKTGIFVDDAAAFHGELQRLGVSVDAAVMLDEALRLLTFVFRDPDGNRIQVFSACADCR